MGRTAQHGMSATCACNVGSMVLETRARPDGSIWRRRRCKQCQITFTTIETYAVDAKYPAEKPETSAPEPDPIHIPEPSAPLEERVQSARERIEQQRHDKELRARERAWGNYYD